MRFRPLTFIAFVFTLIMIGIQSFYPKLRHGLPSCYSHRLLSISKVDGSVSIQDWSIRKIHKLPRIYINQDFRGLNTTLYLDEVNANYVSKVMRLRSGDYLRAFNERDGEYIASVVLDPADSRPQRRRNPFQQVGIKLSMQFRSIDKVDMKKPIISLWFAPIKKDKLKVIFEKATELGVDEFQPVVTQNTNIDISIDGMQSSLNTIIIQSVEQSERLSLPVLRPPISWSAVTNIFSNNKNDENTERTLILICKERMENHAENSLLDTLVENSNTLWGKIILLIGPEGGFTQQEISELEKLMVTSVDPQSSYKSQFVSLGKNVLRAETATIASISLLSLWKHSNTLNPGQSKSSI